MMPAKRYRIATDLYAGYEVQVWRWWWPFWVMPVCNTHPSIERAEAFARSVQGLVVKYIDTATEAR